MRQDNQNIVFELIIFSSIFNLASQWAKFSLSQGDSYTLYHLNASQSQWQHAYQLVGLRLSDSLPRFSVKHCH